MRSCLVVCFFAMFGSALAQSYPEKPVSIVVPFPAGGSTDIVARTVAQRMSETWSQPIVIFNRLGADGRIGTEFVVRAPADGYTVLVGTTALAIGPAVGAKTNYDALKDLAPVSQLVVTPNVLVVHPSMPAKSVRELIALAKARPGALNSASGGTATSNHLALVLFNSMAGVKIAHIPYKGAGPASTDTAGGHVDMTFSPIVAALQLVQASRLRAIAVTTTARATALPNVPTISESGLPGYEASSWVGMFVPAATPRAVVNKIHAAAVEGLRTPHVKNVLAKFSADPIGNTPDEFGKGFRQEIVKWSKVTKASGDKFD